jgi:prophage antirepressor-like protein
MTNAMTVFEKEEFGKVRIVMQDDQPWFVANDVAAALGYKIPKDAVIVHCKYAKILKGGDSAHLTDSPRGINIIPESDLYRLIMRSQLESAEKFQDWVTDEVLPSIRKTGAYSTQMMSPIEILEMQVTLLKQHEAQLKEIKAKQIEQDTSLAEQKEQLNLIEAKVTTTNSEYFSVSGYASLKGVRTLDVREAAKIGRYCAKLSKEQDIHIGKVKDERYGSVNIYHLDILFQAFNEMVFKPVPKPRLTFKNGGGVILHMGKRTLKNK